MKRPVDDIVQVSTIGTAHVFIGTLLTGLITTIGLSIVVRALGPALFGIITIVMILPSIALLAQNLAIDQAITHFVASSKAKNGFQRIRRIILIGLSFGFITGSIATLCSVGLSYFFALFLGRLELTFLIQIASLTIIGYVLIALAKAVLLGYEHTTRYSTISVVGAAFEWILPILLLLLGLSFFGVILGKTIGVLLAGIIAILSIVGIIPKHIRSNINPAQSSRANLSEILKFGVPVYLSNLAGGGVLQFFSIVATIYLSAITLGNYSAAIRLGELVNYISFPIITVLFPTFSKINGKETLSGIYENGIKFTAMVAIPLAGLLILSSGPLILILYGIEYTEAILYLVLIFTFLFFSALGSLVVGSFLRGQHKTRPYLLMHVIALITGVFLSLLLTTIYGAIGLIIATITARGVGIVSGVIWVSGHYKFQPDWISSFKMLVCVALSLILSYLPFVLLLTNYWIQVLVSISIYCLVYFLFFGLLRVFNKRDFQNLRLLLSSFPILVRLGNFLLNMLERMSGITEFQEGD